MPEWDISPNFGDGHVIVEDSTGADDEGHLVLIGGEGNDTLNGRGGNDLARDYYNRLDHTRTPETADE